MGTRRKASRDLIEWAEARRRVEAAVGAPDGVAAPDRVREVLEERARALARPVNPAPAGETLELVTFALANEVYALESRYVVAVFPLADLAPLPGAEAPVFGVTAWRGELLTVLDLRRVLGVSVADLTDLSRVIVVGEERPAFGILADSVREVVTLPPAALRAPPEGIEAKLGHLRGVTAEAVLVLDAHALLGHHA